MLSADQTIIFYLFFFQCIWFSHVLRVREKQSARTLGMRLKEKERKKELAPFLCQPSSALQSNLFIFPVGISFIRSMHPSVFFSQTCLQQRQQRQLSSHFFSIVLSHHHTQASQPIDMSHFIFLSKSFHSGNTCFHNNGI